MILLTSTVVLQPPGELFCLRGVTGNFCIPFSHVLTRFLALESMFSLINAIKRKPMTPYEHRDVTTGVAGVHSQSLNPAALF